MSKSTENKRKGLTYKQEKFCQEFLISRNGTEAAIAAGYSKETAAVIASENLRKPNIRKRLSDLEADELRRLQITTAAVYNEAARIAFSRITDYAKVEKSVVTLVDTSQIPDDLIAAIQEVSTTPSKYGRSSKIKLYDKLAALRFLAELQGMAQKIDLTSAGEKIGSKTDEELLNIAAVIALRKTSPPGDS